MIGFSINFQETACVRAVQLYNMAPCKVTMSSHMSVLSAFSFSKRELNILPSYTHCIYHYTVAPRSFKCHLQAAVSFYNCVFEGSA